MTPQEQPDSQYRNKVTGTIYASVSFNGTPVAKVTTVAGATFSVSIDHLEKVVPDSHDGDDPVTFIVKHCILKGEDIGRYPDVYDAGKEKVAELAYAKRFIEAYADRLATRRAIDEVKNCREGFVVAYQRYEGNEAADKFLRTIIEVFDERIAELTATLTKEGES